MYVMLPVTSQTVFMRVLDTAVSLCNKTAVFYCNKITHDTQINASIFRGYFMLGFKVVF